MDAKSDSGEVPLPQEHVFQGAHTDTCGPSCLAMVYALRGKDIKTENVLRDFKQTEKGEPTYVPQLARHLLGNGLRVKLMVSSSKVVSPAWRNLPAKEIAERLKEYLVLHPNDSWHLSQLYLLFYLQEGGNLDITSYTVETFKAALDRGSTLIACIDADWVWGHRLKRTADSTEIDDEAGIFAGHFVVVTGHEGDKFHILDPFPTHIKGRHGSYDIDQHQLLNASLTWDPQVIEVLK